MNLQTFRIIDANLNRSREALRVMEEYARFCLDDALLTEDIKKVRHALAQSVPAEIRDELLGHREIVTDVGRNISTETESNRSDAVSVAMVAGKRLSEALRAIEEFGKTIDPSFAKTIEQIRYQGYELERRVGLTARARERFGDVGLYVLLTEALCMGNWFDTARQVLEGGANCIQLREKGLSDADLFERARRLAVLCHSHGAMFIVNDRPDVAAAVGADGVHLGQDDLPIAAARRVMSAGAIVGVSTHTIEQVEVAARQAPDYIAVGPMFQSDTKEHDCIAGPELLLAARERTSLPLAAIGGISHENVASLIGDVKPAICVCHAVIAHSDPQRAAREIRDILQRHITPSKPLRGAR